ncbi:unnamed protein product [Cyclocybe aegerita]|uniref:F-box domain-containing protein n=1 Tax=Cyclocybe aegerita TaxID=1973307 RepID=A0A8S0X2N5_CYCAE|nr:unnamed protein product [Cyclocybe aegerita]
MRGLLKDMVDMPMDILYEIFGQLNPIDLLHLARTTKALRGILMSRSSMSVWKEARSNVTGLPDCPDDLSEPQYAELAMGKCCYDCQRNLSTHHIVWSGRVRYCTKCLEKRFVPKENSFPYSRGYPEELARLLPSVVVSKRQGGYTRKKDMFSLPTDRRWREEYAALKSAEEKSKWLKERVNERRPMVKHAEECAVWYSRLLQNREAEKASIIEERKALVVEHLKKMGWQEELDLRSSIHDPPQEDPVVVKACQKEINERVLASLEDHLNEIMESLKEKRIAREKKVLYQDRLTLLKRVYEVYVETLPVNSVHPNTADLFSNPVVRDIVLSDPRSAEFTEDNLEVVQQSFEQLVAQWRKDVDTMLIDLIKKSCPEYEFDPATVLHLATSIFSCNGCSHHGEYTRHSSSMSPSVALAHRCARQMGYSYDDSVDPETRAAQAAISQVTWNFTKRIFFDAKTLPVMTHLVELCGLDAARATAKELDELDPIFECLTCNNPRTGRATIRWSYAMVHINDDHGKYGSAQGKEPEWVLLDGHEATLVRERMQENQERARAQPNADVMICRHCKRKSNSVDLPKHIKANHQRSEVTDEDFVVDMLEKPISLYRLWPPRPEKENPPPVETAMDTN